MAKLTAPLFSLTASGTLAHAITFSSWKGIAYARTRVIPYNPKTDDQKEVRNIFTALSEMWKRMPFHTRNPFVLAVRGLPLTDRNKHVQVNVKPLQGETDLDNLVMSVSGGQAVPPATAVPTDATGQIITVTCTAPVVPSGYTLSSIFAAAIEDFDPNDATSGATFYAFAEEAPYTISVDVLTDGRFQVGAWCVFIRDSDGLVFTSAAVRSQIDIAA